MSVKNAKLIKKTNNAVNNVVKAKIIPFGLPVFVRLISIVPPDSSWSIDSYTSGDSRPRSNVSSPGLVIVIT